MRVREGETEPESIVLPPWRTPAARCVDRAGGGVHHDLRRGCPDQSRLWLRAGVDGRADGHLRDAGAPRAMGSTCRRPSSTSRSCTHPSTTTWPRASQPSPARVSCRCGWCRSPLHWRASDCCTLSWKRRPRRGSPAVLAVGLFAATYAVAVNWFDVGRVDMTFLAFVLATLYVVRFRTLAERYDRRRAPDGIGLPDQTGCDDRVRARGVGRPHRRQEARPDHGRGRRWRGRGVRHCVQHRQRRLVQLLRLPPSRRHTESARAGEVSRLLEGRRARASADPGRAGARVGGGRLDEAALRGVAGVWSGNAWHSGILALLAQ